MEEKMEEKTIMHYKSSHKILLVGEGDFSFAACLANAFGNATNMVATSLDSRDEVVRKYGNAERNLGVLKDKGCTILHEVDAYTMNEHPLLKYTCSKFDRIVYNFPHSSIRLLFRESSSFQIGIHQDLVQVFFKSASELLDPSGQVHVTHKTSQPFDEWNITELAAEADLELLDKVEFYRWQYPGYTNKKGEGHGSRCDESFPIGASSTFMFNKLLANPGQRNLASRPKAKIHLPCSSFLDIDCICPDCKLRF